MLDTPTPETIVTIGAELGALEAELGGCAVSDDAGDLFDKIWNRREVLARDRPRSARAAVVTAAVARGLVHNIDDLGGVYHTQACRLVARLLDHLEAEAGVTAAELGLACYADGRDDPPAFDDGTRMVMEFAFDKGYLAAVARFAPTLHAVVKHQIERQRAAEVAGTAEPRHGEPVGFATEARP